MNIKHWLSILFIACAAACIAEVKLRVFDDGRPSHPIFHTSDNREISHALNAIGIRFEQWESGAFESPQDANIFEIYHEQIERVKKEGGYKAVDVVRMFPDSLKKTELRQKFLNEHTHSEDEVRFFVEGSGLFCLHVKDKVYQVICEKGDLISIPAGYPHWFDMGPEPHFTAIRFFIEPSGWIADFTKSGIAQLFPVYSN